MIPKVEKYYYVDYTDHDNPDGSYFGIAKCVTIHNTDDKGRKIKPLYEFLHPNKDGKMTLSLFYENEVVLDASAP